MSSQIRSYGKKQVSSFSWTSALLAAETCRKLMYTDNEPRKPHWRIFPVTVPPTYESARQHKTFRNNQHNMRRASGLGATQRIAIRQSHNQNPRWSRLNPSNGHPDRHRPAHMHHNPGRARPQGSRLAISKAPESTLITVEFGHVAIQSLHNQY